MFELYPEQRVEGEILLDGDNILTNTQDIALLRAKVGMVFQKPTPFRCPYINTPSACACLKSCPVPIWTNAVALTVAALWNETKDKLHQSGYSLSPVVSSSVRAAVMVSRSALEVLLLDERPRWTRSPPGVSKS